MNDYLTCTQAATLLGVTAARVRQYLQDGLLAGNHHGGVWAIKRADVEAFKRPCGKRKAVQK